MMIRLVSEVVTVTVTVTDTVAATVTDTVTLTVTDTVTMKKKCRDRECEEIP